MTFVLVFYLYHVNPLQPTIYNTQTPTCTSLRDVLPPFNFPINVCYEERNK